MRSCFSAVVLSVLAFGSFAIVAAQDPAPPPPAPAADPKEVAEAIEGLSKAVKEKLDSDQIHFIKILGEKWSGADAKQRKEVLGLAERNLKSKSQDVKDATVDALAKFGGGEKEHDAESATKILVDERAKKPTEDNLTYFGKVCVSIGKLHHPKGAPVLLKLMNYKDAEIIGSAAEGFKYYKDAPIDLKKEIVEGMLKTYTSAWNQVKARPTDNTVKARLNKMNVSMEASLKALTNVKDVEGADKWWDWWNDTGKKAKGW